MTTDPYTPGDPIFEHGGESEREFAVKLVEFSDTMVSHWFSGNCDDLRAWLSTPNAAYSYARSVYRYARELERRRLNG